MAVGTGGSLQLSHGLGVLTSYAGARSHAHKPSEKIVVGEARERLRGTPPGLPKDAILQIHQALLPFSGSTTFLPLRFPPNNEQGAWSIHMSERIYRRGYQAPYRYKVFICRSFATPNSGSEVPLLKSTSLALTRSYNALRESPLPLQLVPAVGIIAFAIWGLEPLMRYIRSMFCHKNDCNWKKSTTHILTGYLQPLLLWTGATLICRTLDPVVLPSEGSQAVKQRLLIFVRSLSTVLAFAYCLSSLIQQTQKFFMEMSGTDDTRNMGFQFAGRAVYTAVWVAAFSLFMELLGFSTQKWVTAGGLGTVLLTLAGREIFTNFLSSVMIHATRPFVLNEWIQTKIEGYEVSGTVEHVGWWSPTIIRGDDREAVHIPNHKFTVSVVRNLSQKTHWRIKTHLGISHLDVNKINNIVADMRKVLAKNPQIEQQRLHRRVFLDNINPDNQALLILVSCFVKTSHFEEYLCVKEAILLDLLRVISHHRARLATPMRTVQKVYTDADTENIPFAETIFTQAGTATSRPLILVEPITRINGDDKAKTRTTSRANEEQATKTTSTSESNVIPASEMAVQNSMDKQQQKANSPPKSHSEGPSGSSTGGEKQPLSETASEPAVGVTAHPIGHAKSENERQPSPSPQVSRPKFEDNIVLGVALEGSKRVLPIGEGKDTVPAPFDASESASGRNGNSSSPSLIDRKSQKTVVPGATDKRDQER